jgi:hypothetical protein
VIEWRDTPLFVGILLEYEYANNKRGLYGLIERYDANRGKYMPFDECLSLVLLILMAKEVIMMVPTVNDKLQPDIP